MTDMLKDKRATRGLRMSSLVGKAADEDDAFWKHEVCIYLLFQSFVLLFQ